MTLIIEGLVDYSHFTFIILTFPYLLRAGNTLEFVALKQCAIIYWSSNVIKPFSERRGLVFHKFYVVKMGRF